MYESMHVYWCMNLRMYSGWMIMYQYGCIDVRMQVSTQYKTFLNKHKCHLYLLLEWLYTDQEAKSPFFGVLQREASQS